MGFGNCLKLKGQCYLYRKKKTTHWNNVIATDNLTTKSRYNNLNIRLDHRLLKFAISWQISQFAIRSRYKITLKFMDDYLNTPGLHWYVARNIDIKLILKFICNVIFLFKRSIIFSNGRLINISTIKTNVEIEIFLK